ncbi:MAG: FecR domain-containing protein [Myxococcales bacterium]|nr:FecR family protein [Myxococcota bacterium]MDW8281515.1 FecR domain-containing protein [Myxococcales bacterium]
MLAALLVLPEPATCRTPGAAGARLLAVQGEVRIKRYPTDSTVPAAAPLPLSWRDEVETLGGRAEVELENGMVTEMGENTLVAIIGRDRGLDLYLARGSLHVRPGPSGQVHSVHVASGAGRMSLRGRDVQVRADATTATIHVIDGTATIWGPGGMVVRSGQVVGLARGAAPQVLPAPSSPRPPAWVTGDGLYLGGEQGGTVVLRWQAVPGAVRYLVELVRTDEQGAPPQVVESEALQVELSAVRPGTYEARVSSVDGQGQRSAASEPRRVVVAGIAGLGPTGLVLPAGTLPRVFTPTGAGATLQVDGVPLTVRGVPAGGHRLRVTVAGLSAEVPLRAMAAPGREQGVGAAPAGSAAPPQVPIASASPVAAGLGVRRGPLPRASFTMARDPDQAPGAVGSVEDVLLLGPSEIPGGGVRSPWAGRLVQVRLESTTSGAARLMVHGRATLRSGLGGELGVSLLRAQLGAPLPPEAGPATGHGNLSAALRSPSLQRGAFALQGIVGATFPLSGSALDGALYDVPPGTPPISLPQGGGWRLEAALLFGVKVARFHLITQQGASLLLSGGGMPAYEGGLAVHADALRLLRLIGFCQWSVHYIGLVGPDGEPWSDAAGAAGGGVEMSFPAPLGGVRVAALGRVGIGAVGAALYGHGTVGLQAGYRFH